MNATEALAAADRVNLREPDDGDYAYSEKCKNDADHKFRRVSKNHAGRTFWKCVECGENCET